MDRQEREEYRKIAQEFSDDVRALLRGRRGFVIEEVEEDGESEDQAEGEHDEA